MSNFEQQLLQLSAQLFQELSKVPESSHDRDSYLERVDQLLEKRGQLFETMHAQQIKLDSSSKNKDLLIELDKGIQKRLQNVMLTVKNDIKNVKVSKQKEGNYINPYSSVQVMDGRYYDKKK
jgi:flagellar protein FliT